MQLKLTVNTVVLVWELMDWKPILRNNILKKFYKEDFDLINLVFDIIFVSHRNDN